MSVFFAVEAELDMYLFPPTFSLDSCLTADLCDFGMAPRRLKPLHDQDVTSVRRADGVGVGAALGGRLFPHQYEW